MPLTGELEHLPIVDVIQLIHSTRKTGTLNVYSRKGEGQLVFNSGYIVGATHSNEKLRIGQILCETNIITPAELEAALDIQQAPDSVRKPLIATLLEHCGLSKDSAFKALETLIEMTIVEMISWSKGFFSFDIDKIHIFDEYRYLPTQLQELNLDTQMVLLDALRIFDEKVHAGEIQIVDEPLEKIPEPFEEQLQREDASESAEEPLISEDILGLADLDKIERKKPHVFKSLEAFDPAEIHRQTIDSALPGLTDQETSQLANFLASISKPALLKDAGAGSDTAQAVIIFSPDELLKHSLATVCKADNILVFTANDNQELDNHLGRAIAKRLEPILLFDTPNLRDADESADEIIQLRAAKLQQFPGVAVLQLAPPEDYAFTLESLQAGVRAVLPKPRVTDRGEDFIADMIVFLETLRAYIQKTYDAAGKQHFANLRNSLLGLHMNSDAPGISLTVLQFVATIFERCITLIVDHNELIAERSIGVISSKELGVAAALKFRLKVDKDSALQQIIAGGELFCGPLKDSVLENQLFQEIGAPKESTVLLAPLRRNNRTITLTYADFGSNKPTYAPLDFIDFFVKQAGIAMENALLRRQLAKTPQPQA